MQNLPRVSSAVHEGRLIVGQGFLIEIYHHHKLIKPIPIFPSNGANIYGIVPDKGGIYIYGEQQLAYASDSALFHDDRFPIRVKELDDHIMAMKPLKSGEIAVLYTCNTVSLYHWEHYDLESIKLVTSVKSSYSCVLLKAFLIGSTWEELYTVVGTVFGDILVSHPSKGSFVLRKYVGHTGMIFGMLLFKSLLFTVSDDRSLRVWNFSTIPSETQLEEVACQYGHTARPFSICLGPNDTILTAGIDQTVYQWKYDEEQGLRMINSILVGIGCVRSIFCYESRVYCGSENGGLISFSLNESPSPCFLPTCDDLRSFARNGTKVYTINGKGHLFLDNSLLFDHLYLRFFAVSSVHEEKRCIVAYGDKNAVILQDDKRIVIAQDKSRILSCVCTGDFVLIYFSNRIANLYEINSVRIWAISFVELLEKIGKKKPLILSSMLAFWSNNRIYVALGSTCGHLTLAVINESDDTIVATTNTEINRHFQNESILSLKKKGECLSCLVKNIGIVHWKWNENDINPHLTWIKTGTVSNTYNIDMPSAFVLNGHRTYIAGFHSSDFYIVDDHGLSAFRFNCGGGNRSWNCFIEQDQAIFEFQRKEKLVQVRQPLLQFYHHQETVHRSQIVFIHSLSSSKDALLFVTGSNDTSMVFINMDKSTGKWHVLRKLVEPSGFLCVHSIVSENTMLLATGCGKGGIIIWEMIEEELMKTHELGLYQKTIFRYEDDVRVLDLHFASESLLAAALADGSIECFSIVEKDISRVASIPPPDLSLFVKVRWLFDEFPYLLAISTSGNIHLWLFKNGQFLHKANVQVASFGLSAIDVTSNGLIAIGSESGEIFLYRMKDETLEFIRRVCYHSCTVTDLKFNGMFDLSSISLDCRLAVYSISENDVNLLLAKSLAIWDPSSFIIEESTVIAVGSGVHTITL